MTVEPLAGYTVAITAARRREEFAAALERRGATVISAPAIRIVPLADDSQLREATRRCLERPLDIVVATTAVGFRGWVEAAGAWGSGEELIKSIGQATVLARGPKVRGAIRAAGLREQWSPESESSQEVLEYLTAGDLGGQRIAVQLHGDPLLDVLQTLRRAGAEVIEVPVYRWVQPDDTTPLERLIEAVSAASVDAVAFTSAPAATSFLRTADEQGAGGRVRAALSGPVVAACVGPVTAGPLEAEGIPVIQPGRSRLGALVKEIAEQVPQRRGVTLAVAGHRLDVRGQAAVVDGELMPLDTVSMALLRELIARPGQVVPRAELLRIIPAGGAGGEHAAEAAIGRLRTALGDPGIIQTVTGRGYRLA